MLIIIILIYSSLLINYLNLKQLKHLTKGRRLSSYIHQNVDSKRDIEPAPPSDVAQK